jgi:hypothetical protein
MGTLDFILNRYSIKSEHLSQLPIPIKGMRRKDLGPLFYDLGFTKGAEIGVWKGQFSETLLVANPNLHMYCVDPWIPYPEYWDHTRHDTIGAAYKIAKERLAKYNTTIIRKFSIEASKDIPNNSLDFVYIDGNHSFQDCVNDLCEWSKKVRVGGIISGHDYKDFPNGNYIHVVEAVHGFVSSNYIRPWFVLGRTKVRQGERTETPRSFMWVKPDPNDPVIEWPRPYSMDQVK